MNNKTDRKALLKIFRNAGIKIISADNAEYLEIEPSNYGENIIFEFDENGNLVNIL